MDENTPKKKIIIVGGGVSGLSAGIYGQLHGFETHIFERNPNLGGLCVGWERKGHKIDGCIHWLTGTREGDDINKMWRTVDAFDQEDIIDSDNFGSIEYKGKTFTFWKDLDKLEKELIEISPEDKRIIKKLKRYTIKFAKMPLPMEKPPSQLNLIELIKFGCSMIPYLIPFLYATRISQEQFAKKFKSEDLRYVLSKIVPGDGNLYTTLYAFGSFALNNGGIPKGGSEHLVARMAKRYENLGGTIHLNKEVKQLVVKNKKVKEILLSNNEKVEGDYFVTCCDVFEATRKILIASKKDVHFTKRFIKKDRYPTPSCVYISYLADAKKLKDLNITTTFEFECSPIHIAHEKEKSIKIRNYLYDETFVKDGKALITVLIHQRDKDFYYWERLRKDYKNYINVKSNIATIVKGEIERKFPSLGEIETLDVVTPMTYKRYVNAHRGAYMPWSYTYKGRQLMHNSKVKGINNLLISGQWIIMPGGLPIALMSGKFAIQHILKKEHKPIYLNKEKEKNYVK